MALDWGPERAVRTPGLNAMLESSEVANVRVVNGKASCNGAFRGGIYGSSTDRSDSGNVRLSLGISGIF